MAPSFPIRKPGTLEDAWMGRAKWKSEQCCHLECLRGHCRLGGRLGPDIALSAVAREIGLHITAGSALPDEPRPAICHMERRLGRDTRMRWDEMSATCISTKLAVIDFRVDSNWETANDRGLMSLLIKSLMSKISVWLLTLLHRMITSTNEILNYYESNEHTNLVLKKSTH